MQIHELETFAGTPSATDYIAVDDGTETMKIPATSVGAQYSAMTPAQAEAGTDTDAKVISPAVLKSSIEALAPTQTASDVPAEFGTTTTVQSALDALGYDYVVSESASNGWYWRKWNSGKVEAWGNKGLSAVAGTAWGSLYYHDGSVDIPSGIFSSAPIRAYATSSNAQWMVVGVTSLTTTRVNLRLVKPVATAQAIAVHLYLVSL